jgi:predicted transcriptional regulator
MTKRARLQGELEQLILDSLWDSASAVSSQQLLERISPDGDLALTTVLTVLSRLTDKGLVSRVPGPGRSFLFSPAQSREEHTAALMLKIVSGAGNPALAFSHFTSGLSDGDLEALRKSLDR